MTHEQIREDLSLFALGSLDAAERRAVEEHLAAGCAECERELSTWGEVVGTIGLKDSDVRVPNLRPRLMQRAAGDRRARGRLIEFPRWAAVPLAAAAGFALFFAVVRERHWSDFFSRQAVRVAGLEREIDAARLKFAAASAELAAKEADVASLRVALASAEGSLDLLRRPGLQLVRLDRLKDHPTGEAHVLLSEKAGRAVFYAFDLPAVSPDKTYELWWITEKEGPVNAGLFKPDAKGLGRIETSMPGSFGAIKAAAVTIEPAAGMPKPTGPMVLLGNVT